MGGCFSFGGQPRRTGGMNRNGFDDENGAFFDMGGFSGMNGSIEKYQR